MAFCSLVFDDGYQETFDKALPILREYNLKATFAVAMEPEHIEKSEGMKCARETTWARAIQQGHEIAAHSITHRALTTLKPDELDLELRTPAKNLEATSLIYPGGAYDQNVKQESRKYYRLARGVEEGINAIPPEDKFALKTFMIVKPKNAYHKLKRQSQLKKYIKQTASQKGWLILSYHLVSDTSQKYRFSTTTKEFVKHISLIENAGLKILSMKDIYKKIVSVSTT